MWCPPIRTLFGNVSIHSQVLIHEVEYSHHAVPSCSLFRNLSYHFWCQCGIEWQYLSILLYKRLSQTGRSQKTQFLLWSFSAFYEKSIHACCQGLCCLPVDTSHLHFRLRQNLQCYASPLLYTSITANHVTAQCHATTTTPTLALASEPPSTASSTQTKPTVWEDVPPALSVTPTTTPAQPAILRNVLSVPSANAIVRRATLSSRIDTEWSARV